MELSDEEKRVILCYRAIIADAKKYALFLEQQSICISEFEIHKKTVQCHISITSNQLDFMKTVFKPIS